MMMDSMIQNWEEAIKTSLTSLKTFAKSSADVTGDSISGLCKVEDFAKIGKILIDSNNEFFKLNESFMNSMIRKQFGSMTLKTSADAIKELEQIRTDSTTRVVKNQSNFIDIFMETGVEHLDNLKACRGYQDVVTSQMHLLSKIQEKANESILESMALLGGVSAGMKAWTERTLDNLSGTTEAPPNEPI